MKKTFFNFIRTGLLAVAAICLFPVATRGATLSWSSTAPTITGDNIGSLVGATADANNINAGADAATYIAYDRGAQGQTFVTGTNAVGYNLSQITLQHVTYSPTFWSLDTGWNGYNGGNFTVQVGTISGGTFAPIFSDSAAMVSSAPPNGSGVAGSGKYMSITLVSPVHLDPNTNYAFVVYTDHSFGANDGPFVEMNGTNADVFASGEAFTLGGSGTTRNNTVTTDTGDRVFVLSLAAGAGPSAFTWNGGGANNNWNTALNWVGGVAPTTNGNSLTFAGSTRLTPSMETNYSVSGLIFSNNASSFTLGTSNGSLLTLGGSLSNNSANAQTLNVPIALIGSQTIVAASGSLVLNSNLTDAVGLTLTGNSNITLNGSVSGGGTLITTGSGTATLSGANTLGATTVSSGTLAFSGSGTNSLGNLRLAGGQMNVTAGTVNVVDTSGGLTRMESNSTLTVSSGATLNIGGSGGWWPVGVSAGQTATIVVNGGTINVANSHGAEIGNESGSGVLTINSGTFVENDTDPTGLQIGAGSMSGEVDLNGGVLIVNKINDFGTMTGGNFYFNGGTLKPLGSTASFWNFFSGLAASIRNGGAIVDTTNFNVTIAQPLIHSTVGGDNATDGGLTKIGNGTLILSGGYTYTGPTKILGGSLSLNSSQPTPGSAGDLVVSNATLVLDASSGTALPAANVTFNTGATSQLTNNASVNAINGAGNLLVQTNTTINLNYGTLGSNPSAAAINVAGSMSVTGTNNVINITGTGFTAGQFPLIKYGSGSLASISGFKLGSMPAGASAVLTNNTGNQSVDLNITFIGQSLTWYGTNAVWDINTTYNWNNATATYLQYGSSPNIFGDVATFDDNLYNDFSNPQSTNVNLVTTLRPAQITVNSALPYSFTGAGTIAGAGGVTMSGSGSLFLGTSNSFTGGVMISAGTLIVTNDNALGTNSGLVTLSGGTLAFAASTTSTRPITTTAASAFDVTAGSTAQLNGLVSGGGLVTKTDNGTLALGGANNSIGGSLHVAAGTVSVTGGSTTLAATSPSSIGYETGAGTMNLAGTFTALGNVWVGGSDMTGSATGTLNISSGTTYFGGPGGNGTHFGDGSLAIAASQNNVSSCSGTVTVSGGTVWVTNDLIAGYAGKGAGTLNISGAGAVNVGAAATKSLVLGKWDTSLGVLNISGGNLNLMNNSAIQFSPGNAVTSGTNVITQSSGTVAFFSDTGTTVGGTGDLNLAQFGSATANNTYNLNGGTLIVPQIGSASTTPTRTFNFNGGTLKAAKANTTFMNLGAGNAVANVRNGGAIIDDGGFAITLAQMLVHSTIGGDNATDGGLTKLGNGTVVLSGANSYTGNTTINAGVLELAQSAATLATNSTVFIASGAVLQLDNSAVTNIVASLKTNGITAGNGLYSSANSAGFITGLGYLQVGTVVGPSGPAHLTNSVSGTTLSLSWPSGQGWRLQIQTNSLSIGLSTNWVYLTDGSVSSTNITVDPTKPTSFYRLTYP